MPKISRVKKLANKGYDKATVAEVDYCRHHLFKCEDCERPATSYEDKCPYHGGHDLLTVVHIVGIPRSKLRDLLDCTDRTIDNLYSGNSRQLNPLELRGILSFTEKL